MRITSARPIATMLVLVGASIMFTGCGDEGAHLPAGMSGASAAYTGSSGNEVIDSVLGSDPGPTPTGVSTSSIDDPVLADYDGTDEIGGLGTDDPYSQAIADWDEHEGSIDAFDESGMDEFDDGPMPVGYGNGGGYGNDMYGGYGSGGGVVAAGGWGNDGMMDAGFEDPGFSDPGVADPGMMDVGFDPGVGSVGMDPGVAAAGVGMDAGFVDPGVGF